MGNFASSIQHGEGMVEDVISKEDVFVNHEFGCNKVHIRRKKEIWMNSSGVLYFVSPIYKGFCSVIQQETSL